MNKVEQRIIDHVERFGWSIMKVAPRTNGDDPQEWFAYTIGLPKTFGWPELVCFGLGTDLMGQLLSDLVAECRDRGIRPMAGMTIPNIVSNAYVKLVDASVVPIAYLNSARWFAQHTGASSGLERLQMLWPDKAGLFPDDPRCEQGVREAQTPLERLR